MRSRNFKHSGLPLLLSVLMAHGAASGLMAQEDRGWLGISLQCKSDCSRQQTGDVLVWSFSTPPVIQAVRAGGPAARAGLQVADEIVSIAGVDITTEEGGRMFGALKTGVPAQFTIRRAERMLDVTVTPGTAPEAFGEEWKEYVWRDATWDSLRQQMKQLYEGQLKLQIALRNAERALERTETRALRTASEEERQRALSQRTQIDSIRQRLADSQRLLRLHTDSLAVRTLRVPRLAPEVTVVVPPAEPRAMTIYYPDAVAGARFEELSGDSPLVSDFPDVKAGLLITRVVENTPAYLAGLRQGDVVLAVSGEPVHTVTELRSLMASKSPAELTYIRKGKKQTCKIPSR